MSPGARTAAVALAGSVAAAALALALGSPPRDAMAMIGIAGGGSLVASLLGRLLVRRLAHRNIRLQVLAISVVAVVAVAVGLVAGAVSMFLSRHDLQALLVILAVAGAVGVSSALELAQQVEDASRTLGALARRIGADVGANSDATTAQHPRAPSALVERSAASTARAGGAVGTAELASLAEELAEVSARLDESRERERRLDGARRELVAWISHDLRTPLAGIRAMVEALEDGVVADTLTVDRYHRAIRQEADRLACLVDDLFELSRINAGARVALPVVVPLADLVAEAFDVASVAAEQRGVELQLSQLDQSDTGGRDGNDGHEPDASEPGLVSVAPSELVRVVRNLLDNALRHTPPGGRVRVETRSFEGSATVAVRDQCGGIPEPDLARVFEPGFRGDTARSPGPGGGTGLGLAIAVGFVEAHGGSVDVVNTDTGCCFTVRLPTVARPAPAPRAFAERIDSLPDPCPDGRLDRGEHRLLVAHEP